MKLEDYNKKLNKSSKSHAIKFNEVTSAFKLIFSFMKSVFSNMFGSMFGNILGGLFKLFGKNKSAKKAAINNMPSRRKTGSVAGRRRTRRNKMYAKLNNNPVFKMFGIKMNKLIKKAGTISRKIPGFKP